MRKKILFLSMLIFLILSTAFLNSQNIPLFIKSQTNIFQTLSKEMSKHFPNNIEILSYELNLMNGPDELKNKLNESFNSIISSYQSEYKYSIIFEEDIPKDNKDIDISKIKEQNEQELISLGKFLNQDAVMLSSITIIEDTTKKVWNKISKAWQNKRIALFQGNFFNTENNASILRFSYYFLLD